MHALLLSCGNMFGTMTLALEVCVVCKRMHEHTEDLQHFPETFVNRPDSGMLHESMSQFRRNMAGQV